MDKYIKKKPTYLKSYSEDSKNSKYQALRIMPD